MNPQSRLNFIDRYRGWALILMIETHVFNECLSEPFRSQGWFMILSFINGLIAPSFLFLSGFVFAYPRFLKPETIHGFKIKKILMLLMIAYGLHLPFNTLHQTLTLSSEEALKKFYQADILQCMAAGWLILSGFFALIKKSRHQKTGLLILALIFILPAPLFHGKDFSKILHPALSAYLNHTHYSMFPLFPWMGFLVAGALAAAFFCRKEKNPETESSKNLIQKTLITAAALILPGILSMFFFTSYFRVNPLSVSLRLGMILLLAAGFYALQNRKSYNTSSIVEGVGSHSLFVYVFHLILLYHPLSSGQSFSQVFKRAKDPVFAMIATLLALIIVLAAVWLVKRIKNFSPLFYQKIARLILGASLLNFLFKPY